MKIEKKNILKMEDTLIPDVFIQNHMLNLELLDIKVYIFLVYLEKSNLNIEKIDICKRLNISEADFSFSIDRLEVEGVITKTEEGFYLNDLKEIEINKIYIPKIETKKTKAQSIIEQRRIAAATAINESFFQGIMSLNWYTDISVLFEKYNFSEEVMIALFHYCQVRKALNKKYVYAVAQNWFDGNVKTFEDLETYLENFEKIKKISSKINKALRLNRNFTKYEEQYINKWVSDFLYDFSVIEEALKRTVNKSNPSIVYIDAILTNWFKKGFKTLDDISKEKFEKKELPNNNLNKQDKNKTTKYQSYDQRNYENLEAFYDNV